MTSRTKRILLAATTFLALVAFFWMRSVAYWRPVKLGKTSNAIRFLSEDGKTGLSFIYTDETPYVYERTDLESGHTTAWPETWPDKNAVLGFSKTSPELVFLVNLDTGKIKVREVRTAKLKQTLRWVPGIFNPHFVNTSDASIIAMVGEDTLFLWNLSSAKQLRRVPLKNPLAMGDELYALSADGTRLVGCSGGQGTTWNAQSGRVLRSWTIKGEPMLISNDGRVLAYRSGDLKSYLFVDSSTGKVLWQKQRDQINVGDPFYPWLGEDDEFFLFTSQQCEVFDLFTGHLKLKRQLAGPRKGDGDPIRITRDYIYCVHNSSDTPKSNGEIWRWRAR